MLQMITTPRKLWITLDEMKNHLSTEAKTSIAILVYTLVFLFFNYCSNGNLMVRVYDEYELHQKNCMIRHGDWSPTRSVCLFMGYTVCPLLFSASLLIILIFEYALQGLQDGLLFLCGNWCKAKMMNK